MRSILAPVEEYGMAVPVLNLAAQLADAFDGTVDAVPLRPMHYQVVGAEPIIAVTFPPVETDDQQAIAASRAMFEAFQRERGGENADRLRWRAGAAIDDAGLGTLSRVYDVTVVGRVAGGGLAPRMTALEAALFDGGRPILIAPPQPPATFGQVITIAWNCSTETARTLAFAMPLVTRAREVNVLTVEGATVPGPSGADVCAYLSRHGVSAREVSRGADGRRSGEAMLQEAAKLGTDLMIKGAYTQSRLRQMIFGGATSTIIAETEMPVFMAH